MAASARNKTKRNGERGISLYLVAGSLFIFLGISALARVPEAAPRNSAGNTGPPRNTPMQMAYARPLHSNSIKRRTQESAPTCEPEQGGDRQSGDAARNGNKTGGFSVLHSGN